MTIRRFTGTRIAAILICVIALATSSCCRHHTCCVPYSYAPPPPLPYLMYKACPTPIAKKFRRQPGAWVAAPEHVSDAARVDSGD